MPKGMQLSLPQWLVHRDERFFEDAKTFKPERWVEGFEKSLPKYAYFPFGGGPRLCIGNNFAMMEAVLLLATLAQKYSLELNPSRRGHPAARHHAETKARRQGEAQSEGSCESSARVNPWLILTLAIIGELVGTTALKLSAGFTRFLPSLFVIAGYGAAIWLLSQSIQRIPMGVSYAVWSGAGRGSGGAYRRLLLSRIFGLVSRGVYWAHYCGRRWGSTLSSQPH